jgi:hypothetical protein
MDVAFAVSCYKLFVSQKMIHLLIPKSTSIYQKNFRMKENNDSVVSWQCFALAIWKGQLSKDDQLGPTEMESSTHHLGKFGRETLIVAGTLSVAGSRDPLRSQAQLIQAIDHYPEALPCYIEICTTNLAKGLLDAKL